MNLRGVRESGTTFAFPVYAFMIAIIGMGIYGFIQHYAGTLAPAESAPLTLVPEGGHELTGLAAAFLLLRAFSSGCAALTGVEAISNGVPAFRKPKSDNAATTLLLMGALSITMLGSIIALGRWTGIKIADDPATQLLRDGKPVGDGYIQQTAIGQLSQAVFADFHLGVIFVSIVTGLILVLAANTAFNGFPVLGSILARDGYLPRQMHTRGDRLAFSNGILILAGAAILLVIVFKAEVTALIQLYIVGVFVSFTTSQIGMVRHWTRHLRLERDAKERGRMQRSRVINAVGAAMSGTVLLVVLLTKFQAGAKYAILAMVVLFVVMLGIKKHYARVRDELAIDWETDKPVLPSHVHAIVCISKVHKPTMRALSYARASRPSVLEAVTVDVDPDETRALIDEWERHQIPVPLKVLASPYRQITRPILDYVRSIRSGNPRDVVTVYLPEYVLGKWWEQVLHNQSALRLKARLLFTPGVMVVSVPWQLASSQGAERDWIDEPPISRSVRGGAL
jgi:amino acid transporter